MGIINHNAIIATTYDDERAEALRDWIVEHGLNLFAECKALVNSYHTFVLVPDGSKEGWTESDTVDTLRDGFVSRLAADQFGDGSSPWAWVEVGFGEYGQKVLRGNNVNCYGDEEYAAS